MNTQKIYLLLVRFLLRLTLFCVLSATILLFLFFIGNIQDFTESSLWMLFSFLLFSAAVAFFVSMAAFIFLLFFKTVQARYKTSRLTLTALAAAYSFLLFFLMDFIKVWLRQ